MSRVQVNDPGRPLCGPRKTVARLTPTGAGWLLPAVLSTTAGAVDIIGFLALGGLFTAHITGNVVILAAHYVVGGFSEVGPLLSVPVFVAVLGAVTLASGAIEKVGYSSRRPLLVLQAAWLIDTRGIKAIIAYGPPTTLQLQLMSYARHHAIPLILDLAEWPAGRNLPGGPTGLRKLDSEFRMRYLNRKSDNIIAISSFLSEYYRRFGRHVIRIPPLIDLDEPKWKTPSKNKSGALRLIYAGTPGNKDLLGSIIRGTLLFQSEIRAIELHLVGVTEEQARNVDSRCLTSSKASNIAIICHGRVAQEKVPAMLARASFSVLLRPDEKYAHAGFATKLVESLSAGTPVIANATSDVAEYIRDGHEGLIVNGYSPEALAATLNIAAALPETKRLEMSNAARARAREVFDYRSRCSELRQFLALLPGTRSRH